MHEHRRAPASERAVSVNAAGPAKSCEQQLDADVCKGVSATRGGSWVTRGLLKHLSDLQSASRRAGAVLQGTSVYYTSVRELSASRSLVGDGRLDASRDSRRSGPFSLSVSYKTPEPSIMFSQFAHTPSPPPCSPSPPSSPSSLVRAFLDEHLLTSIVDLYVQQIPRALLLRRLWRSRPLLTLPQLFLARVDLACSVQVCARSYRMVTPLSR